MHEQSMQQLLLQRRTQQQEVEASLCQAISQETSRLHFEVEVEVEVVLQLTQVVLVPVVLGVSMQLKVFQV
jgi:hypothetical protein